MPVTPVRSQTARAADDAFAAPLPRRRPTTRTRTVPRRRSFAWLQLPCEVLLGAALAVVPVLIGLPLGAAALAALMGAFIAVTALSTPVAALPLRGSRMHDRLGIDGLLIGLAALLWVVGEAGVAVFVAAAALHATLAVVPGRRAARR
jgi:hypothetical protein